MIDQTSESIVGCWFLPTKRGNWIAAVNEIEPDARYKITCRFRYYKDDKVFDSADEKHWYSGEFAGTRAEAIGHIHRLADLVKTLVGDGPLDELLNTGDHKAFLEAFDALPYVHKMPKEVA